MRGIKRGRRRRGEAGNEAQGSSANPAVVREDMLGTKTRTSFSSFECEISCTHLNMLMFKLVMAHFQQGHYQDFYIFI